MLLWKQAHQPAGAEGVLNDQLFTGGSVVMAMGCHHLKPTFGVQFGGLGPAFEVLVGIILQIGVEAIQWSVGLSEESCLPGIAKWITSTDFVEVVGDAHACLKLNDADRNREADPQNEADALCAEDLALHLRGLVASVYGAD